MTTQSQNSNSSKQKRMSPDVAELLHMLSTLETRSGDQPAKTSSR